MRYPILEKSLQDDSVKADCARYCDVSEFEIGKIANGQSLPSVPTLKKIAAFLRLSIDYLVSEEK
ncbi:MAG: helix-turn-helix transcriptional regulator [Candidatus Poribacteria bacterium]|nr:helix-turn-helix transcriptional regulator [Candidatus Poribacteria bacterium]